MQETTFLYVQWALLYITEKDMNEPGSTWDLTFCCTTALLLVPFWYTC